MRHPSKDISKRSKTSSLLVLSLFLNSHLNEHHIYRRREISWRFQRAPRQQSLHGPLRTPQTIVLTMQDDDIVLDISNDPEIERLGANATAVYALQFWKRLCDAARKDAQLLDPLWPDMSDRVSLRNHDANNHQEVPGDDDDDDNGDDSSVRCHHTKELVLVSPQVDVRLWKRFRSNFGTYFAVDSIAVSTYSNPLVNDRWRDLIMATEGSLEDYNFLTLLRANCYDCFWMTETTVCENLLVVPRAQFLFIEITRIREGWYNERFRQVLQFHECQTTAQLLSQFWDHYQSSHTKTTPTITTTPTTTKSQDDGNFCTGNRIPSANNTTATPSVTLSSSSSPPFSSWEKWSNRCNDCNRDGLIVPLYTRSKNRECNGVCDKSCNNSNRIHHYHHYRPYQYHPNNR